MQDNIIHKLDIERENPKQHGRFKSLNKDTPKELNHEKSAEKIVENIIIELNEAIEQELVEKGHIHKEEEISVEKFQKIQKKMDNIEKEWAAAFKGKEYSKVKVSDLKILERMLKQFLDALKYEIKITKYLHKINHEFSNMEVDKTATKEFLKSIEDEDSSEVGKHIKKINEKNRYDLNKIQEKTKEKLKRKEDNFKKEIIKFEEEIEKYQNYLEILQAIEMEIEEIESETKTEKVERKAENIEKTLKNSIKLTEDLINKKQKVLQKNIQAKHVKKNINKIMFKNIL